MSIYQIFQINHFVVMCFLLLGISINATADPQVEKMTKDCSCICTATMVLIDNKRLFAVDGLLKGEITQNRFSIIQKEILRDIYKSGDRCVFVFQNNDVGHGASVIEKNGKFVFLIDGKVHAYDENKLRKLFEGK